MSSPAPIHPNNPRNGAGPSSPDLRLLPKEGLPPRIYVGPSPIAERYPHLLQVGPELVAIPLGSLLANADSFRILACAKLLAGGLQPRIEIIGPADRDPFPALLVHIPPLDNFWDKRLARGDEFREAELVELANKIAAFHFHFSACPRDYYSNLGRLLLQGMRTDWSQLEDHLSALDRPTQTARDWVQRMENFLLGTEQQISLAANYLMEPIRGYCDIVPRNIVSLADGSIAIIDLGDPSQGIVRTRRMDAAVFRAELMLLGQEAGAERFWFAYNQAYLQQLGILDLAGFSPAIQSGIDAIDAYALFSRYLKAYSAVCAADVCRARGCAAMDCAARDSKNTSAATDPTQAILASPEDVFEGASLNVTSVPAAPDIARIERLINTLCGDLSAR